MDPANLRDVAALAYLLLPVSGAAAYALGSSERVRRHGLQAIFLGLVWPVALYVASFLSPTLTQGAFLIGAALWIFLLVGTAIGGDPSIPVVGPFLRRLAGGTGDQPVD